MKRVLPAAAFLGMLVLSGCSSVGVPYRLATPPPPIRVEARGLEPGPGYFWVAGYWGWNRAYVWVPGQWLRRPRPRAI